MNIFDITKPCRINNTTICYVFDDYRYTKENIIIDDNIIKKFISIITLKFDFFKKKAPSSDEIKIASISRFVLNEFDKRKYYTYRNNRVELSNLSRFEIPELDKSLDGPFTTFEDLETAYIEFIERENKKYRIDEVAKEDKKQLKKNQLKERTLIYETTKEPPNYSIFELNEEQTLAHFNKYLSKIAETLDITENKVYEFIDTKKTYIMEFGDYPKFRGLDISGELNESNSKKYYGKVDNKWIMIYNHKFEHKSSDYESFDTEEILLSNLKFFVNSLVIFRIDDPVGNNDVEIDLNGKIMETLSPCVYPNPNDKQFI